MNLETMAGTAKNSSNRVSWTIVKLFVLCLIVAGLLAIGKNSLVFARTDLTVQAPAGADSATIQNLLNQNANGQYNLTVVIPAGEYHLTRGLTVYSYTTIQADEAALFVRDFDYYPFIANDTTNDPGGYDCSTDITVIGGIWDANQEAHHEQGIECFRFIHSSNITVQSAEIKNVPEGSHMITLAGVNTALIDNNLLHGYNGTLDKEAIHLDIVHDVSMVPGTEKYDDTANKNITIQNNEIYDYPRAIGSHSAVDGVFQENVLITNNYLHDISGAAIKLYCYKNTTVSLNTMKNVGIGVRIYTYLDGANYQEPLQKNAGTGVLEDYAITVTENTISDLTAMDLGGYGIQVNGSADRMLQGVVITNNIIKRVTNTQAYGIRMTYCVSAEVTGNTIASSVNGGLTILDSDLCTIKSNLISYVDDYGIYTERLTNSAIAKNKIWNVKSAGIYLNLSSNGCTLSYNKINAAGDNGVGDGIGLNKSSKVTLYKNTVRYAEKNAIALYNGCSNSKIVTNYILSPGENAIALYYGSNSNKIKTNIITTPGKNGIALYHESLSNTIAYNKIYQPAENGIAVYQSSNKAYILENTVSQSGLRGIFVYVADEARIIGNTIKESKNNAIHVGTSANTYVEGNVFVDNLAYRLMITSDSTGCNVTTLK